MGLFFVYTGAVFAVAWPGYLQRKKEGYGGRRSPVGTVLSRPSRQARQPRTSCLADSQALCLLCLCPAFALPLPCLRQVFCVFNTTATEATMSSFQFLTFCVYLFFAVWDFIFRCPSSKTIFRWLRTNRHRGLRLAQRGLLGAFLVWDYPASKAAHRARKADSPRSKKMSRSPKPIQPF